MYLLYADKSGDTGLTASPTNYFILSGLVVHETRWRALLDDIVAFRQHLRATKGLKLREEIHAAPFITNPGPLVRIKRNDRLDILGNRSDISICTVVVNKTTKAAGYDVFESAWQALIQQFENTMQHLNYPGSFADQHGLVLPDNTDGGKLTNLIRRMRHYNPVPNNAANQSAGAGYRNLRLQFVIEDPFLKFCPFLHSPTGGCGGLRRPATLRAKRLYAPQAGAQLLRPPAGSAQPPRQPRPRPAPHSAIKQKGAASRRPRVNPTRATGTRSDSRQRYGS